MEICIIIIFTIYAIALYNHYEPSIDIIVEGKKYRVLVWYNNHTTGISNKHIIVRSYIQLFII